MNFKRTWIIAAVAAVGVVVSGCQPPAEGGSTAGGGSVANSGKRYKIGVSIPAADHGWTAGVGYWAKEASKAFPNVDWVIEDAKDANEQITDLENLKNQNVDAMVILATESAPITGTAEKLHDAGILIVNVDRGFTKPVADVFIEGDNKAFGRKSAEFMVDKLNKTGNIVILRGVSCTVDDDRVAAAMEVFKANPGIKVVATERGEWNREKADKAMQNILTANPKIDAVWAADDDMALGAETAIKAAGRDKSMWILGGAGMKDIVKRVMDKDAMYPADITYPPSMIAIGMQNAVGMLMAGKDVSKQYMARHMMIDVQLITPDNAKDFYFEKSVY